jgi:hypothetical protein
MDAFLEIAIVGAWITISVVALKSAYRSRVPRPTRHERCQRTSVGSDNLCDASSH